VTGPSATRRRNGPRPAPAAAPRGGGRAALAAVGILVIVWEALVRVGVLSPIWLPAPSAILIEVARSSVDGELPAHVAATALRVVPGLFLGVIPGIVLGLLMGWSPSLRRAVDPIVAALHPLPKIAILPLLMLVFGLGEASRIAVIAVAAFFPVLISAMAGARGISPLYFEVATNYGAGRWGVFRRVVLPASLPGALAGLRISVNAALTVAIAVEIIVAERGLGSLVWRSWEVLQTELLYATLLVIALLGVALNAALVRLRGWWIPWEPGEAGPE